LLFVCFGVMGMKIIRKDGQPLVWGPFPYKKGFIYGYAINNGKTIQAMWVNEKGEFGGDREVAWASDLIVVKH
jgi:hypothetical protein